MSDKKVSSSRAGEEAPAPSPRWRGRRAGEARGTGSGSGGADGDARAFALEAAKVASELKCTEVSIRDVRGLSPVCDYLVIASGTSERQMRAVAQEIEDLGKAGGSPPFRQSRDGGDSWIVIDFVDVVVHLFEPEQRAFYDIDGLWNDAPLVPWRGAAARRPSGEAPGR